MTALDPQDQDTAPSPATKTSALDLRIADLVVQYAGNSARALDGISLTATPGAVTAVVGPNGSGKSTIVRALLRLSPRMHGVIQVGGESLESFSPRRFATTVSVVPQREEPLMPMQVRDYVALGRHAHRSAFGALSADDRAHIADGLLRTGMAHASDRRTDQLSGGEWQRVRIARALAQNAPVLVLDEPTSFLDIAHEMAVFELLDTLATEGRTVLLVSHQLNLVARFASHIVLLHAGHVAAAGSANEVMRGELLEQVYEWPLVVTRDAAVGALSMLPLRGRGKRAR
jgi:iron complex transport system ATP-binding protein